MSLEFSDFGPLIGPGPETRQSGYLWCVESGLFADDDKFPSVVYLWISLNWMLPWLTRRHYLPLPVAHLGAPIHCLSRANVGARMPQGEEQLQLHYCCVMRSPVHSRKGNECTALQDDLKHPPTTA